MGSARAGRLALLMLGVSCGDDTRVPVDAGPDRSSSPTTTGSTTTVRQCAGLAELQPLCACLPGEQCFVVSDSYGVCSTPNQQEATSCSLSPFPPRSDQCGCNGAACPQGQGCRLIRETVSGGSFEQNRCYAVCQSTADCPGQQ